MKSMLLNNNFKNYKFLITILFIIAFIILSILGIRYFHLQNDYNSIKRIAKELKEIGPHSFKFGWYHDYKTRVWQKYPHRGEVVFLGDSLTEHGNWQQLFPEINIVNQGIGGDTVKALQNRLNFAYETRAHTAVVMIGTNDIIFSDFDSDEYIETWLSIFEAIAAHGMQVVVVSIVPSKSLTFNQIASSTNDKMRNICNIGKCKYVDFFNNAITNGRINKEYTNDGVHLSLKGYDVLKFLLSEHLQVR